METTPWWGFILLGFLVGFQWGFKGLGLLFQRRDWNKQKVEWRRQEMIEAQHDDDMEGLAELFESERNRELRFAQRITLADLRSAESDTRLGMKKRRAN